jgi:hypothetical protein
MLPSRVNMKFNVVHITNAVKYNYKTWFLKNKLIKSS